ncbi:MAG: hypothetical protein ABH843_06630 [Candidatus Omnitrophota bacterium]
MNQLIHNIINKFNVINLMCGTTALEIESSDRDTAITPETKDRLKKLVSSIEAYNAKARQMLDEIIKTVSEEPDCYKDNEHFFKVVEPGILDIEEKRKQLGQAVADYGAAAGSTLSLDSKIINLLHTIEEKALTCGIMLKELRGNLVKSGKYNTADE